MGIELGVSGGRMRGNGYGGVLWVMGRVVSRGNDNFC